MSLLTQVLPHRDRGKILLGLTTQDQIVMEKGFGVFTNQWSDLGKLSSQLETQPEVLPIFRAKPVTLSGQEIWHIFCLIQEPKQ